MSIEKIFNLLELEDQMEIPTVAITYWGSSHYSDRHGFQKAVKELPGKWLPGHKAQHTFFATGGKQMSRSVVEDMMYDTQTISPADQHICILGLGDNDLRAGRPEEDLLEDFNQLISRWHEEGRGILIITGMMPCPRTEERLGKEFARVSQKIKEMVKGKPKIQYFSTARLFVTKFQTLRREYYKDKLHLTDLGSHLICSNLQQFTNQMVKQGIIQSPIQL